MRSRLTGGSGAAFSGAGPLAGGTRPALCTPGSPSWASGQLRRARRGRGVEPLPFWWRRGPSDGSGSGYVVFTCEWNCRHIPRCDSSIKRMLWDSMRGGYEG
ncbi:hypothetical protein NDU88_004680 [Pleurodeles waltl]|uniref:Uncharacterized protein n=1 Tax=Pleurodeles waltl TaxID=8319 RepID=A0AAV7RJY1_PLEWA|nr:hypothetical protein NDU88_004680 [Pleurodeles waltl]